MPGSEGFPEATDQMPTMPKGVEEKNALPTDARPEDINQLIKEAVQLG